MKTLFTTLTFLVLAPSAIAQEAAPAPSASEAEPFVMPELSTSQQAAYSCAMTFALVSKWQKAGDDRGTPYPDMESEGGREYFVRTMAALMDDLGLNRAQVMQMATAGVAATEADGAETVEQRMSACSLMLAHPGS